MINFLKSLLDKYENYRWLKNARKRYPVSVAMKTEALKQAKVVNKGQDK